MKFLVKARWLVVLKNDKMFVTEDECQPAELYLRLAKKGVTWREICVILKLPLNKPRVV